MRSLRVAIDGPSGAGKTTVARGLAAELGLPHVETGAFYRAVTLAVLRAGVSPDDPEACAAVARSAHLERKDGRTLLDSEDVEDELRSQEITAAVSAVAAHPGVREALIPVQRAAAADGGVVEGRDIGTVVLPDADLKIYLTASPAERARRRAVEQAGAPTEEVAADLARRDTQDASRAVAPLARAEDAREVDTTDRAAEEVVSSLAALARTVAGHGAERREQERQPEDGGANACGQTGAATNERPAPREQAARPADTRRPARSRAVATHRALPRVAVVGRPNVGKSTLVNRFIGRREAIVDEQPGVTRDRTEYPVGWRGRRMVVVDTGGYRRAADGVDARVVEQTERAAASADLVVFVVDARVGPQPDDEAYAQALRRAERPVLLAVNKVDGPAHEPDAYAFYSLGLGDPHPISAAHGRGIGDLLDAVVAALPAACPAEAGEASEEQVPRVAVVGRPNVGKSLLFNRLLGEERSIVDPVPHTTRDAVDTLVEVDGQPWWFVDTAGLRRRYRHGSDPEIYSVDRTRRALNRAGLVLFVVDASEPLAGQDQRLAAAVRDAGCGVVLVCNKWDRIDDERRRWFEAELDRLLYFTTWAPRINTSAVTGRGLELIMPWLARVWDAYRRRVPTAELNAWLAEATAGAPPPATGDRPVRIRYITQAATAPPTFVLFSNGPVPDPYRRYLERQLRRLYDFVGTPLVFVARPRA